MNINLSISCVGSMNFINSISAIVLIPSFQSLPSIPSNPWSIVSLSPVQSIQSVPYSLHSLTSDSINSICTSESFQFIPPTKKFHWFPSQMTFTYMMDIYDYNTSNMMDIHQTYLWLTYWIQYVHSSYMMAIHLIHKWWTFIIFINDGHLSYSCLLDIHHISMMDIHNIVWLLSWLTSIIYDGH